MKTKITFNTKKTIVAFTLLLVSSISLTGQNATSSSRSSSVNELTSFLDTYKEKYKVISETIEAKKDLKISEKLALYENEVSKLREEFKTNRKAEYLTKRAKRAKRVNCTGTHTRNVTKCVVEYILAPNENMYTTQEWIKVEGSDKIEVVLQDEQHIAINMTATGKRINKAVVSTTFKYKKENISDIVNKETSELFSLMAPK